MPKKFIPPQTDTATRTASTPIQGEIFYDTDENQLYYGNGATQGGKTLQGTLASTQEVTFIETTEPTTPSANNLVLYVDSADGALKQKNDAGTVTVVGSGSGGGREVLTADRTYYVRTDGSDSNDGLTDSAGGAFLTIQKAIDVVASLDVSIFTVTIKIADGTYNLSSTINLKKYIGKKIVIEGNTTTPENVVIEGGTNGVISAKGLAGSVYLIRGVKLQSTTTNTIYKFCIECSASILELESIDFGTVVYSTTGFHIWCKQGGLVKIVGNYSISGNAAIHINAEVDGTIDFRETGNLITVSLVGTRAFNLFAYCSMGSVINSYASSELAFSGSATGTRYNCLLNSVINTNGGGANFFPGNGAGGVSLGGQYN